jgi:hypothetical protein
MWYAQTKSERQDLVMQIHMIDKNFSFESTVSIEGLIYRDVLLAPFAVYGIFHDGSCYRRMPEAVAKEVSDGVYWLHRNTVGGRVRFRTDSPYIAIHAEMP